MNEIKKKIMHATVNESASYLCNSCNSIQVVYSFTSENICECFHDDHHHIYIRTKPRITIAQNATQRLKKI